VRNKKEEAIGSVLTSGRKEEAKTAEKGNRKNYHLTTSGFVKKEMKKVVKQAAKMRMVSAIWAKPNQAKSAGLCYEVWP
jgi:hypothetical protein